MRISRKCDLLRLKIVNQRVDADKRFKSLLARRREPRRESGLKLLLVARMADPEKNEGSIWIRIDTLVRVFKEKGVALLYLSRRQEYPETSIISSAESAETFKRALSEILSIQIEDSKLIIFPLVRMKLFEVPENIGKEASRFLITIKTAPKATERIYQLLSGFRPSSDTAFTYLAFISNPPCNTLTLSAFAKSNEHLQRFIQQEFRQMHGIISINQSPISKTKRLIPYSEMVDILRRELGDLKNARPILDLSDLSQ